MLNLCHLGTPEAVNIEFVKPKHSTKRKVYASKQQSSKKAIKNETYTAQICKDYMYEAIYKTVLGACLFTIILELDTDTSSTVTVPSSVTISSPVTVPSVIAPLPVIIPSPYHHLSLHHL